MLEFSSTESCTTSNTSTPLVGFSSNDSSCDGNVALMNDFESTGGCSGQGPQGPDGFSAYQIAVFNGFVGTEEEWLASLVGPQGIPGTDGTDGVGVPPGGTAGQILTKIDSTNYNTFWQDNYADWTSVVKHIVKNDGTGLILKGTPVYVTGSNGTNMLVGKASNISEATSSKTMGLMQTDITTTGGTQTGFVITEGLLAGLNTAGRTAGEPIWLGPNGTLIYGLINKPYAPAHLVFIGIVTKVSAGNGEVFVKIQNGFELKEIHDVDVITTTPVNGDVLGFNGSLWVNKTIPNWLGYTPFNLPSLTSGSVLFSNGTTLAQDNANFFWDDTNNRLGIGTATPISTLDVNGQVSIRNGLNFFKATTNIVGSYNADASNYQDLLIKANSYDFSIGAVNKLFISSAGNLGIGETSPLTTLDIRTSLNTTITPLSSVPNASTTVLIGNTGTNGVLAIGHNNTGKPWLQGRSRLAGAAAEDILINPLGGNVGIGTTAPLDLLQVGASSIAGTTRFNASGIDITGEPSSGWAIGYKFRSSAGTLAGGLFANGNAGAGPNYYTIGSAYNVGLTVLQSNGNVGINTTNPLEKLQVNGKILVNNGSLLYIDSNAGGSVFANSGALPLTFNTNSADRMIILSNGNVGIGTTAPTAKLQVKGDGTNPIAIFETSAGALALSVNNSGSAFGFGSGGINLITTNDGTTNVNTGTGLIYKANVSTSNTTIYSHYFSNNNIRQAGSGTIGLVDYSSSFAAGIGSANFRPLNIGYTINNTGAQTGTATGIFLNATETALNGMVHNLMDLQVGSVSKFRVTNSGTAILSGLYVNGLSNSFINSTSNGTLVLYNSGGTDFNRIQLGGTTSSFPAIKRNGAGIDFRLADDSGFCAISAAQAVFTNTFVSILFSPSYYESTGVKQWLSVANTTAACSFKTTSLFADSGTINASARVQIDSTTQGFLPPRMTTAQKTGIVSPATGLVVFDTDLGKLCVFAVTWQTITSV